jgi:hypothetical protein
VYYGQQFEETRKYEDYSKFVSDESLEFEAKGLE